MQGLKFYRKEQKMSQAVLAERIGVKRQTIVNWEKGLCSPGINNMKRLTEVFNCDIKDLY